MPWRLRRESSSDVTPTQSCQFQLARLPARSNLQLASSPTSSRINLKIVVTSKVKPLSSDPVSDWRKVSESVAKKFAQLLRALVKFKQEEEESLFYSSNIKS